MKFTLKTTWADFLAHKNVSSDEFNELDAVKANELVVEFREGTNKALAEAIEGTVSKEDLEVFQSQNAEAREKQLSTINNIVKGMSAGIQKDIAKQTFSGLLMKSLVDNRESLTKMADANKGEVSFAIKVDVGIFNTIEAAGSASQTSITQDTGIVSVLRKRLLTYLSEATINTMTQDEPFMMWIEELDEAGNPIFLDEETTSPEASVRYEERRSRAKTVAVSGKVTSDFLRYTNNLYNFFQNNLLKRMDIVVENGLFTGDGTGDNLAGLETFATAFDGGIGVKGGAGLVGLVDNANNWDVIKAVALQVYNSYGEASALFVDSDQLAAMELEKDAEGQYIMPPFKSADGTTVSGMRLIPTTANIGTGVDFIGGDLSVVNVGLLLDTAIEIGRSGTDLKDRKWTVVMERQLTQFVSANDTQVLVKGDFTSAKALLETP